MTFPSNTRALAPAPRHVTLDNGGPFAANLDISLSPSGVGTKVQSRMEVRPDGAARLVFPIFAQMVRRQEKAVPLTSR